MATKKKVQEYSFPVMDIPSIIRDCSLLDIHITDDDIKNPQPDVIRAIVETFLYLLTGTKREDFQQPIFSALDQLTYPELHDESIPELGVYRAIAKLMAKIGIHNFCMKDLNNPTPKRVTQLLSGLLNFAHFKEERYETWRNVFQNWEQLNESRKNMEVQSQELKNQLGAWQMKRQQQQPQIEELQVELNALQTELMKLTNQASQLQGQTKAVKELKKESEDRLESTKFKILNTKQECEKLRSQIIPEPDKLKGLVEDMKVTLENEKDKVAAADKRSHDLQTKLDTILRVERELQKSLKLMEECGAAMTKHKLDKKTLKEGKARLADLETKIKDMTAREQLIQKQLKMSQEKLEDFNKRGQEKLKQAEQGLEEAMTDKQEVEKQRSQAQATISQLNAEATQIQQKMEAAKKQHEMEMEAYKQKYMLLQEALKNYHHNLFLSMKAM